MATRKHRVSNSPYAGNIRDLLTQSWFQAMLADESEHGLGGLPPIPEYTKGTVDTAEWAYDTGVRHGYELALTRLGVEKEL